jgi:hypothetical protein
VRVTRRRRPAGPRLTTLRRHPRVTAAVGALSVLGLLTLFATGARAEDQPTSLELLDKCGNGTDYCEFHVSGPARTYFTTAQLAGQTANCTDTSQNATITWEHTTTSSNSLGTSLSVSTGAGTAFSIAVKVSYQHDWTSSHTRSDATQITIPARSMGRVYTATEMEKVSGQYEMHFGDRYHGHYYWYLPMTVDSPKVGDPHDGVTAKSTPLTEQEATAYCG